MKMSGIHACVFALALVNEHYHLNAHNFFFTLHFLVPHDFCLCILLVNEVQFAEIDSFAGRKIVDGKLLAI